MIDETNEARVQELAMVLHGTTPPLVHFTTADLNNLADDKYDTEAIAQRLGELGAVVLVTPEHLLEWAPLERDSRERRFLLADRLPSVAYHRWESATLWTPTPRWELQKATSDDLRDDFYEPDGAVKEWILSRRRTERMFSLAEFFQRGGERSGKLRDKGYNPFDVRYARKFHKANGKHGSNVWPFWVSAAVATIAIGRSARLVGRIVPRRLKVRAEAYGYGLQKRLKADRVPEEARFHGVDAENVGFRLWWETHQKLWAKPDEVGGLNERIDFYELRFWTVAGLLTLDRRVDAALQEALRSLRLNVPGVASRFVRCGSEERIIARLDQMLAAQAAALTPRGVNST